MLDILKQKPGLIGLDIGHDSIKMIQLSRTDDDHRIFAAEKAAIFASIHADEKDSKDIAVSSVRHMLEKGGFQGRKVVSTLPGEELKIKSMRFDSTDPSEIQKAIRTEVAQSFGLDPVRDEIHYMFAGKVYQGDDIKNEVIFFGAEKSVLERHLDILG